MFLSDMDIEVANYVNNSDEPGFVMSARNPYWEDVTNLLIEKMEADDVSESAVALMEDARDRGLVWQEQHPDRMNVLPESEGNLVVNAQGEPVPLGTTEVMVGGEVIPEQMGEPLPSLDGPTPEAVAESTNDEGVVDDSEGVDESEGVTEPDTDGEGSEHEGITDGTVEVVKERVHGGPLDEPAVPGMAERAQAAYDEETAKDSPRSTLVSWLESILTDPEGSGDVEDMEDSSEESPQ